MIRKTGAQVSVLGITVMGVGNIMQLTRALALVVGLLAATQVQAETLKVGFVATLSGPARVPGIHMRDGFMLGVEARDGKLGGRETKVLEIDDHLSPALAASQVSGHFEKKRIDLVVGGTYSSTVRAMQRSAAAANRIMIGVGAGPAIMAGPNCSPNYFSIVPQAEQTQEAMGRHATQEGYQKVMVLAADFPAGRAAVAAFRRHYNGVIVEELFTTLGQYDFSEELKRLQQVRPEAVFAFMPGGMGVSLVRQYTRFGLKYQIPLLSAETINMLSLPETTDSAIDYLTTSAWSPDLDNEANKIFVRSFLQRFGYMPSHYAAQGYDAARLLDAAYAMAGDQADDHTIRTSIEAAPFKSVRGDFVFNKNHFPIQDFYLSRAVKAGPRHTTQVIKKLFDDVSDAYFGACRMEARTTG